jgi:hypothetical protein
VRGSIHNAAITAVALTTAAAEAAEAAAADRPWRLVHGAAQPPLEAGAALARLLSLDASIGPFDEVSPLSGGVSDPASIVVYEYGGSFLVMGVVAGALPSER